MSRPLRVEFPGALYHVTARGNDRAPIFLDDSDRRQFLLLLATPEANLSRGMRQLNGVYTQRFNRSHERVGHVFQGRFHSVLVEREGHLAEVGACGAVSGLIQCPGGSAPISSSPASDHQLGISSSSGQGCRVLRQRRGPTFAELSSAPGPSWTASAPS